MTATATSKGPKLATHTPDTLPTLDDFKKMSVEQRIQFAKDLEKAALADGEKLFVETIEFLQDKLKKMGRTPVEAAVALYSLMDLPERNALKEKIEPGFGRIQVTPKKEGKKEGKKAKYLPLPGQTLLYQDKTGAKPKFETEYKLPDGTTYKTGKQFGRTPDAVCAALHAGHTWEEMEIK